MPCSGGVEFMHLLFWPMRWIIERALSAFPATGICELLILHPVILGASVASSELLPLGAKCHHRLSVLVHSPFRNAHLDNLCIIGTSPYERIR